jgi:hypothetical protein
MSVLPMGCPSGESRILYIETAFPVRAFFYAGVRSAARSCRELFGGVHRERGQGPDLGQHGDNTIENSDGDDEDADKRLVSVLHGKKR